MTDVICDYDFCKHYEDGRCGLDTVEICGGHCQDIDDEQESERSLREIRPNLRRAFYANYKDQDKADELIDKIDKMIGKE